MTIIFQLYDSLDLARHISSGSNGSGKHGPVFHKLQSTCSARTRPYTLARLLACIIAPALITSRAHAHEAWLLTPDQIAALATEPMPAIFTSHVILLAAAMIGASLTYAALFAEHWLNPIEDRFDLSLRHMAITFGPIFLRCALGVMIGLAATGGLPRHGTEIWTEPTLFVPDMQLGLIAGWAWLQQVQIVLAIALILGFGIRAMGWIIIGLAGLGVALFGTAYLSYAPHFIAPALILIILGAGPYSVDQTFGWNKVLGLVSPNLMWRVATILTGAGFIYLAVAYKLVQPTLLIAILEHGSVPTFGLPLAVLALVMTGVEIICGALLIMGRLVRPVALTIMGAITFLAITLGETPLFHANLYGAMLIIALVGANWRPTPVTPQSSKEVLA